jgi:enhancer of polycomb-like protein
MTDMIHAALGCGGNMKSFVGGVGGGQHPSSILPRPPPPRNIVVAGHDDGYPAPNFLQPLASRESHFVTSWDYNNNSSINGALSMPSYINGISTTTPPTASVRVEESFRHRPRLGRGGRIIIDRIPMVHHHYGNSSSSSSNNAPHHKPPPTVITYGSSQMKRRFGTTNNNNDRVVNGEYTTNPPQHYDLLLQPSLGDTTALTRKIEEICALGLMEDYHTARSNSTSSSSNNNNNNNKGGGTSSSGTSATAHNSGSLSTGIPIMTTAAGTSSSLAMEEMDEVLIPIQDWFEAPESMKIYGSEKFVIGPL